MKTIILAMQSFKFNSVINRETSYSNERLSDDTESEITVQVNEDGSGWFEWDVPELEVTEGGMLEFNGNDLEGYDGVFELPAQLLDFLEAKGYNVDEVR